MSVVIEPVEVNADYPEHIANWRPLVSWLLVIPQLLVTTILMWLFGVLSFIAFFTVLFTKKVPRGMFDPMVMILRYSWRTNTYAMFMREGYPPFDFTPASAADDPSLPADPAHLGIDYAEELNRWLPLVKWFLAIPHYIALFFLGLAASSSGSSRHSPSCSRAITRKVRSTTWSGCTAGPRGCRRMSASCATSTRRSRSTEARRPSSATMGR
jgi:hypothetical protein